MAAAAPAVQTRITALLGCKYPLILPGMSWISTAKLVAAVSNAGGCGILATGPLSATETRSAIQEIRRLAPEKPFGVGVTLLMPGSHENAEVALDEQVPLINTSLGKCDWIAKTAHMYGGKVLGTVTNYKHAERALEAGCDALMATGHEAAAHGGDVTSLVLIPSLVSRFPDVPIVGCGGFADGRGLAAALSLGADGVAMGSRFAVTAESPLARSAKDAISNDSNTESDTIYGKNFDGIHARVLKTSVSERANARPAPFPLVLYRAILASKEMKVPLWKILGGALTEWNKIYTLAQFGSSIAAIKAATVDGDLEHHGVQFVGQSQGLIRDIPEMNDLVQHIIREARTASVAI